jgi:hypothetical protein
VSNLHHVTLSRSEGSLSIGSEMHRFAQKDSKVTHVTLSRSEGSPSLSLEMHHYPQHYHTCHPEP